MVLLLLIVHRADTNVNLFHWQPPRTIYIRLVIIQNNIHVTHPNQYLTVDTWPVSTEKAFKASGDKNMSWLCSYFQELQVFGSQNIFLFWFGFYGPSRLFHSFWTESIGRGDENGRSSRKTTWPPASRTWLVSLDSKPQQWDDERFRALKMSILNHSAMGATSQNMSCLHR